MDTNSIGSLSASSLPGSKEAVAPGTNQKEAVMNTSDSVSISGCRQDELPFSENPMRNHMHPAYKELGSIKHDLEECSVTIRKTEIGLYGTDNHLQDASRRLNYIDPAVKETSMDTPERDVAPQGDLIEKYMGLSRKDINQGEHKVVKADENTDRLKKKLADSYVRLKQVRNSINQPEEFNAQYLVDKSMDALNETFISSDGGQREIKDVEKNLKDVNVLLGQADCFICGIKSDEPGKDVSGNGAPLDYISGRTLWELRDTERHLREGEVDFHVAGEQIKEAITAIDVARDLLKNPNRDNEVI